MDRRARVVVVDDDPELLRLLSELLEDEGYSVLPFLHPISAQELQRHGARPGLFLIDLVLPETNGIEWAAQVSDAGFAATPKIAMSAMGRWMQAAEDSGLFQATLEKPFDISELLDCIERALFHALLTH